MKKKMLWAFILPLTMLASCQVNKKQANVEVIAVDSIMMITDSLRFNEATYWNGDTLYIGNFGGKELNPLNTDGKGYIVAYKNGQSTILIPADGRLNAPKGMFVKDNHLFVADVASVKVFNLADISKSQQINFPTGELFLNDIASDGDNIYITVTNTGNIYKLNVADPSNITAKPQLYTRVPGANGIVITDSVMYVASYPPDGNTSIENVIYTITNKEKPVVAKLFDRMGQYDGLALSQDGKSLFFTTWVNGGVGYINLADKSVEMLAIPTTLVGPADITLHNGKLYIPDLPNSRVIVF